ncbi:MAG: DUF4147 domain-containing protein [Deltaproteobacteria bacterium]|nr:DUF4147 domain-containing protein [Deltaproteobacteria bacterium]
MADLAAIFRRTVDALSPEPLVVAELAHTGAELMAVPEVCVIALGKAAPALARGAARVLPHARGLVIAAADSPVPPGFELIVGDHPVPGTRSLAAGRRALELAAAARPNGGALFLVGGGASALCELPVEPLDLARLAKSTEALMLGGAPVQAMNAVRKHLSQIKGGQLAAACPAAVRHAYVLSDVVGDAVDAVGSGPAVPDTTTFDDALEAFRARDLPIDAAVLEVLGRGLRGEIPETPKLGDSRLRGLEVHLLAGVASLAERAAQEVQRAKLLPVRAPELQGPLSEVAPELARAARTLRPGQVLVTAGEVTLRAGGPGQGGRAQHLALTLARELMGEPVEILVAGSDGHDYTTDAAGALLDGKSWARAIERGLDPDHRLATFDSATLCRALNAQIPAFDSPTNLTDLVLLAKN